MEKQKRATYDDLIAVPPPLVAEILDGTLVTHPRPAARHASTTIRLSTEIDSAFRKGQGGPGGWLILFEPELHLGPEPDVPVPDIAGWRRDRMPELPDVPYFTLAPDWACEVLSSSTEAIVRADKMPIYSREKVANLWLVNPIPQTLEIFRLEGGGWRLASVFKGEIKVRAEPFDAIELDLASLWAR